MPKSKNKSTKREKLFKTIHKNSKIIILSCVALLLIVFLTHLVKRNFVASVNGKLIGRTKYLNELEKNDAGQTLNNLITKEIIYQEAKKANITIGNDVINTELSKISQSLSSQGTTLEQALTLQGLSMDDLVENIKIQKILEKLLANQVTISDDEIAQRFEQTKSSYPDGTKLEDVSSEIKDQLFQEKLSSAYSSWIQDEKAKYNIKYF